MESAGEENGFQAEKTVLDHQVAWSLDAWGAFTIGVEVVTAINETNWLELDLAECQDLPYLFRSL